MCIRDRAYYSLGGTTRSYARAEAKARNADLIELTPKTPYNLSLIHICSKFNTGLYCFIAIIYSRSFNVFRTLDFAVFARTIGFDMLDVYKRQIVQRLPT